MKAESQEIDLLIWSAFARQQATYRRTAVSQRRRISELPKSVVNALHYPPRKQTSSPLPEVKHHRIYERGHIFSKSWNPERYVYYETPPDADSDASVPTQIDDDGLDPYKKFYHEMMRVFGSDPRVSELAQESAAAVADRLNVRHFSKQAKSFDDRLPERRATIMGPRSLSEAEQRQLVRQQTVFHLQPQNQISEECLNLWADRKMLELNADLANQVSTDLSTDQSASTSFESNTEPAAPESIQRRHSSFLELPYSADTRRQKYKSLLLHRQHLSNTVHPQTSSFESALSSESSAADSLTVNGGGTASFDSTRSDQTDVDNPLENKQSRQLSDPQEDKNSPLSARREYSGRARSGPYVSLARRAIRQKMASSLQRDYSVDSKSDRLFREFIKVDPKFETAPQQRSAGSGRLLPRRDAFSRHRTVDIADVPQHVTVPLICFPEEPATGR
ncbi:hypothetical protein Tcan_15731 [Toxocara canis]|uniref:Uncharacterized protein n=1 Tax=Toxocara canis TaxID=6265 RepID=A0A0B2VM08_TOXCA|nr:hypothetical protein Tcan_15731 [Toxocara canis]